MSDFWLKIGLSATFQASGTVAGYSITYAFWMNCSIQLSSIHSPLVASYITLTLTDSNYRVLFPIVQRRQASPFLRRRVLYPAELWRHARFLAYLQAFSALHKFRIGLRLFYCLMPSGWIASSFDNETLPFGGKLFSNAPCSIRTTESFFLNSKVAVKLLP